MQKLEKPQKKPKTKASADSFSAEDTWGLRGAGATWQASFGMQLSEADLLFSVRREPVANRIVFQVAHDIFDNWFEVEEASDKPDPKFNASVQQVLNKLDAKAVFTQAAVYERLFGWAIVALTYVDYGGSPAKSVKGPKEIKELLPYSSLQFTVQSSDEDKDSESSRFGLPVLYTVRQGVLAGQSLQVKLHFSRVIHLATRLLDHAYKGMSVLEPVYDDLTVLRNIRWGMGQTLFRYGSGFPDVTIEGAKKKDLDDLEDSNQFKCLQARTYFLHKDKTTLEFKGVAGRALNPEPYYLPIMENISAGSGVPLAILRGAQAGELTGSEVNEREYFKLISDAQSRFEPAVRELIDRLIETGQIRFRYNVQRGYRIRWLGGFEMNEKDKADVELRLAQARSLKSDWKTVDEIRAEEDLDPLGDEKGGGKVLGMAKLGAKSGASESAETLPSPNVDSAELGWKEKVLSRLRRKKA
jgi:hypothetical protein